MALRASVSLGLMMQDEQVKRWVSRLGLTGGGGEGNSVCFQGCHAPLPLLLFSICSEYSNMVGRRVAMVCIFPPSVGRAGRIDLRDEALASSANNTFFFAI